MSMCGEVENLEWEIQQKKAEVESLEKKLEELKKVIDDTNQQTLFDMHIDPDKRNWEYDGDGRRIPRTIS